MKLLFVGHKALFRNFGDANKVPWHTIRQAKKHSAHVQQSKVQNVVPWHEHTPRVLSAIHQ